VSCVDALEEPLGALWISAYVPCELGDERGEEAEASKLGGVDLPPPEPGAVRAGFWKSAYAITPLWREQGHAFRLTCALSQHPTRAASVFPDFMRRESDALLSSFRTFLHRCRDLSWRALFSGNCEMYDCVRRHLAERAPPTNLPPSPLIRLSFSELSAHVPVTSAEACGAAALPSPDVPAPASTPPALSPNPRFSELSAQLPLDWAEYCEPLPV